MLFLYLLSNRYAARIMIFILRENNYHYLVSEISDINEKLYLQFSRIISIPSFRSYKSHLMNKSNFRINEITETFECKYSWMYNWRHRKILLQCSTTLIIEPKKKFLSEKRDKNFIHRFFDFNIDGKYSWG